MPDGWETCSWGDVVTLEYGKALNDYRNGIGIYPVYGTNGPIGFHTEALCKQSGVIIGRKGAYRGVHYSNKPFWVIDTAFYLKPKIEMDTRWAYYQLLTQDINAMDSGSAIPSTSRPDFYGLRLQLPPLPEQKIIAGILSALDDKIELNRRINETLESMARALFQSWFVDFDPVRARMEGRQPFGMDAETAALFPGKFIESRLGSIPAGWGVEPVGNCIRVIGGTTPSTGNPVFWEGGNVNWVTPKDLSPLLNRALLDTERKITPLGLQQIGSGLLPKGTVLMSSRAPIGYFAIVEVPVAINQGFIAMICDGAVPNHYALNWAEANMDVIVGRANGTTFLEISKASFRPIPMLVPSIPVLDKFRDRAEALHRKMVNNLEQSSILISLRDALLPKLMSGEVRVREAEQVVEAVL